MNPVYIIDLNSLLYSGLVNQLYSLVNGIIICHLTNHDLAVPRFYPQYNLLETIPLEDILDLPHLQKIMEELEIKVYILPVPSGEYAKSKHFNPALGPINHFGLKHIVESLKSETGTKNLGYVFSDLLFKETPLFPELIRRIKFSPEFEEIVESLKIPEEYLGVHLRIEDDMLEHFKKDIQYLNENKFLEDCGRNLYLNYRKKIFGDKKIFLATYLGKKDHRMNWILADLSKDYTIIPGSWRKHFPQIPSGREIDAIIDYIVMTRATRFIGFRRSTFSQAIEFSCKESEFVDYSPDELEDPNLLYKITKGWSGCCEIKVNGDFGERPLCDYTLAAHIPSEVTIELKYPVFLEGYCSGTAQYPPALSFICDEDLLGIVQQRGKRTPCKRLEKGLHTLKVKSDSMAWGQSIWLFHLKNPELLLV